ncbi:GL19189 [Drosophila persimilis]|uniref:GL19189 n=1 Tax=Drosophila persimilis TaxID=7234 RepID=B4G7N1_DROPE|nr:GL19189 [Drosophila persimilis]
MDNDTKKTIKEWCVCEKLPRAVLHIPLDCNRRCDLCGLERRPKTDPSSSDEEEYAANLRQKMLLERRRAEEALQSGVRLKVPKRAKKPCSVQNCKKNCLKCGGMAKPGAEKKPLAGYFPTPKEDVPKWRLGLQTWATDRETSVAKPTAAPPSSSSSLKSLQLAFESMWEPLPRDLTTRVDGKRLVIPLKTPITDPSGGAISKRNMSFASRLRAGTSRPLPPLSKVVASIMAEQEADKGREKGGGLGDDSIEAENQMESQFCPFDSYEGPSEDALVVDSARIMLQTPMALNTKIDRHLLPLLLVSSDLQEGASAADSKQMYMKPSSLLRDDSKDINNGQPIAPKAFKLLDFEEKEVKAEKKSDPLVEKTFTKSFVDQVEQMMKSLSLSSPEPNEDCAAENEELKSESESESESESNGSANPPDKDVSNERVISSNKSQTDAKYSKVLSKKLNSTHGLHEPANRVCRTAGMKREGAKPMASGMSPVWKSKLGAESASSVCDKCGHHRNDGDAAMPNKNSRAKIVKQTPKKEPKEFVGPYRSTSKIAMPAKKICQVSKELFGKQPSNSLRVPDKTDGRTIQPHMLSHSCMKTEVSIHWRRIHTLETVSHVCGEILKPKMASHRCTVMESLKKITLSDQPAASTAIYEFRMPDIDSNAFEKSGMASPPLNINETHRRNEDGNKSGCETPVAHSPTPRHKDLFLRKMMRKPSPPICPVPSIKYIRRKIRKQEGLRQYDVSELSFMRNTENLVQHKESAGVVHHDEKRMTPFRYENIPSKADHLEVKLGRRIRREHSLERRFNMLVKPKSNPPETKSEQENRREYLLKVKLEEMMTKPIQLLTPHEET